MTQEEKAKAYDEALQTAKMYYWQNKDFNDELACLPIIFPELKESKDERIRKEIIKHFEDKKKRLIEMKEYTQPFKYPFDELQLCQEALAWLEKQGKNCLVNFDEAEKEKNDFAGDKFIEYCTNAPTEYGKYVDECLKEAANHFFSEGEDKYSIADLFYAGIRCGQSWLEKIGDTPRGKTYIFEGKSALEAINKISEEKVDNANKAELKDYSSIDPHFFKTIDKVEPRFKAGDWIIHHGTENIYQVVAVIDNQYQLKYGDNYTIQNCADVDRCARLWDISKDAKEPYVISTNKELLSLAHEVIGWLEDHKQFAAKDDIQYIQDCIEKIRSIQLPQWSEEDEEKQKAIIGILDYQANISEDRICATNGYIVDDLIAWLKSLKPQPKQEWSEEDNEILDSIIEDVDYVGDFPDYPTEEEKILYNECKAKVKWLKFLRPQNRWKPSEEQIKAFEHFVRSWGESGTASPYDNNTKLIYSLLQDLKKLKG